MSDLRMLIVAEDPLVRAGLANGLATQPGCTLAGQESVHADLIAACELHRPDVLVWDMGWDPGPASVRVLATRLETESAILPAIVMLVPDVDDPIALASSLRHAGVRGLLPRSASSPALVAAAAAVVQGWLVLDPAFVAARVTAAELSEPSLPEALTPREVEVLQLLAEGLPNKLIAQRLGVSEHTVKFHVNALMGKLGAASRTEAVVRATRRGLILL